MKLKLLLLTATVVLSACASTIKLKDVTPLANNATYIASEEEKSLLKRSNKLHKSFLTKGLIVKDSVANQYISDLAAQISPEFNHPNIALNFYILKDASVNAFALPNGNIYLNVGLISKLSTQTQLSYVMSHEVAHVIQRHGLKKLVDRKNTIVGAHVADLMLFGTGLVYFATIADLASYSRAMEEEADEFGLSYLATTTMNVNGGVEALQRLKEGNNVKESASIWNSHPETDKRIEHYKEHLLTLGQPAYQEDKSADETYQDFRRPLALKTIKIRIRNKQFSLAQEVIEQELLLAPEHAELYYYLAEVQRLKGTELPAYAREYAWLNDKSVNDKLEKTLSEQIPDLFESAQVNYDKAQALNNQLSAVHKGRGLLALHNGEKDLAKEELKKYLLADDIKDRRYIKSIITTI